MIPEVIIFLIFIAFISSLFLLQTINHNRYTRLQGCMNALSMIDNIIDSCVGHINQVVIPSLKHSGVSLNTKEKEAIKDFSIRITCKLIKDDLRREVQPYINLPLYIKIKIEDCINKRK